LSREKGITLVEVMFSIAIVSMVLAGTLFIFVQTADMSKRVDYEYVAANLVKSRLEEARAGIKINGFNSLPRLAESESDDIRINEDGIVDPDGDFVRVTTVEEKYDGNARMTKVEVKIYYYYRGEKKESRVTKMATIFTTVG